MTGFLNSLILWRDVLDSVFSDEVSGVDIVLDVNGDFYTYNITGGVVAFEGKGDLHDKNYEYLAEPMDLTANIEEGTPLLSNISDPLYVRIYPNEDFFVVSNAPRAATIGAVCITVFTSLLFFLYDYFVRREFHHSHALLEAKRAFMRFVSHEVSRTSSSVCLDKKMNLHFCATNRRFLNFSTGANTFEHCLHGFEADGRRGRCIDV